MIKFNDKQKKIALATACLLGTLLCSAIAASSIAFLKDPSYLLQPLDLMEYSHQFEKLGYGLVCIGSLATAAALMLLMTAVVQFKEFNVLRLQKPKISRFDSTHEAANEPSHS